MSETAANDAAVAAPAPQPVQPQVEATEAPQAPSVAPDLRESEGSGEKPKDRVSRRGEVAQRAMEAFKAQQAARQSAAEGGQEAEGGAAGEAPKDGPARDEQGRFAPKSEAAAPEGAAHAEEAKTERGETPPEGFVRIELKEGHPWRRGDFTYVDAPAAQEQAYRTVINAEVRRADVERLQADLQKAQREKAEMAVRLELAQEGRLRDPAKDAAAKEFLEDVKNTYPDLYDQVRLGLEKAPETLVEERVRERLSQLELENQATSFVSSIQAPETRQKYDVWSEQEFSRAVAQHLPAYGDQCDRAGITPDLSEFLAVLDSFYVRDPRVQAKIKAYRQQHEQSIEARVRERLASQRAEEAGQEVQQRHRTVRGLAQLAAGGQKNGQRAVELPDPDDALASLPPSDRRAALKARAMARATGRFQ